tara:strand:- start:397 stop:636 length:240 start_codon:yes stop_codon:yes gene_type:complete
MILQMLEVILCQQLVEQSLVLEIVEYTHSLVQALFVLVLLQYVQLIMKFHIRSLLVVQQDQLFMVVVEVLEDLENQKVL